MRYGWISAAEIDYLNEERFLGDDVQHSCNAWNFE